MERAHQIVRKVPAFPVDLPYFTGISFRKAFAHESFGYLRRGDDGEEKEVDNSRLSTVLSGTPEQVKSLIRDAENGLLSRFMFFCINSTPEWLDGFDSYGGDSPLEETFDAIGEEFTAFTKILENTPKIRSDREFARSEARRKRQVHAEVERELQEQFHIPIKLRRISHGEID